MAQGTTGLHRTIPVTIGDSPNLDSFSRLRVSHASYLFDAQLTYNLRPLLFEQLVTGTGASISHDSTNRCASLAFSSTPAGGTSYMQSFEHFHYQPGRSLAAFITFNFVETAANVLKFVGLSDGTNGVELQQSGSTVQFVLYSGTSNGTQTKVKADWNLDKFDGTGPSGIVLDLTKCQILVLDLQALYVGRVRIGFDIGGNVYYAHEFNHANLIVNPYIQTANLPVRAGMTCSGTATTTMKFICSSVCSESGDAELAAFPSSITASVTAASGAATHALSIRPRATYNGIVNRTKIVPMGVDILGGNNPVLWQIVIGQGISGTTTFTDVNTTHSSMEYNSAGTVSGSPTAVLATGFVSSSAGAKGAEHFSSITRVPITLDAAGVARANGTLTLLLTGLGGTSACQVAMDWMEIR